MNGVYLIVLTLVCLSCSRYHTDPITPVEMTRTAMTETFVRINIYAETNKMIPVSLEVLPKRNRYANRTIDGWGRPLRYSVSENGIITLTSLGQDGNLGGEAEDSDISESYYSKRSNGTLWVGSELWLVDAEVKVADLQPSSATDVDRRIRSTTNRTASPVGRR